MKSITLKSLFFGLFLVATFVVKAQEEKSTPKYTFATITQIGTNVSTQLAISIEGQPLETKTVKTKNPFDNSPIFEEVANLQEQGWVVFNANNSYGASTIITYFLRKRK